MGTGQAKVVVVGVGNILLKDEGIGVHVVRALQAMDLPGNIEVIDGGTLPDVFLTLEGVDKLVVVDAVKANAEPGDVFRFRPEDVKLNQSMFTSVHEVGLLENLWLMERSGQGPKEVVIIGVEPESIELGLELSPKLTERLTEIVRIVLDEIGSGHLCRAEEGE